MNRPGLCYHNNAGCQRLHDRTAFKTPSPIWPCFALPFLSTLVSSPQLSSNRSHEIIFAHSALPTAPITSTTICAAQNTLISVYSHSFHVITSPCSSDSWSRFLCIISLSRDGNSLLHSVCKIVKSSSPPPFDDSLSNAQMKMGVLPDGRRQSLCGWAAEGELTVPGRLSLRLRS